MKRRSLRQHVRSLVALWLLMLSLPAAAQQVAPGLRVPAGFEVVEFADSKLANDIFCMTLDPHGRVVVSGAGYIRVLVDDDNDGRADRAIDVAATKEGAQGLLWEDSTLLYVADGGLRRLRIKDDRADGASELIRGMRTGGEHHAHALRRGPDGWLYLLCGNTTGIDRSFAQLPTSPIKEPVAGCVVRFTPDLKASEVVADGFRNPYDMDFNLDGELFTYDSDNERCVSLPWYEFTRVYHVIPGAHHGWLAPQHGQFWRLPPYCCDVTAPMTTLGRGSPTGVACYRHVQFPERYRGGLFVLDWTFGRVWLLTLKRSGSTYTCEKEVFLEAVGENGFAPTAAVVHPLTGDLYISIGGRGTRGAVYRVRHPEGLRMLERKKPARVQRRTLDWWPGMEKELLEQATSRDAALRLYALTTIRRHLEHLEAPIPRQAILANWDHSDRYVRRAAAGVIAALPSAERQVLGREAKSAFQQTTWLLGNVNEKAATDRAARLVADNKVEPEVRLSGVRLVQLALGDVSLRKAHGTVWEGYSPRRGGLDQDTVKQVLPALRDIFPTGQPDLDREISRTLALLEDDDPGTLSKIADRLGASPPIEDIHYLAVLSRLRAPRPATVTAQVADVLLALDRKVVKAGLNRERHWMLRVGELHGGAARKDPGLNAVLLAHTEFGRPDHALFAQAPGFNRNRAAEIFLARAEKDEDYPWNAYLIEIVGSLPAERSLPVLRRLYGQAGLDESLLPVLARQPQVVDRDKFLRGLGSPQLAITRLCLEALEKLPASREESHLLPLVQSLRRLADSREEKPVRERLARYLQRETGQEKLGADKQAWTDWFAMTYPDLSARLGGPDGVDVQAWQRRLVKVNWPDGDAQRGKLAYIKANCAACHSGGQALGPDLAGVTGRFSRDDLLTSILQPSKDISSRYRTTQVETAEGKLYQGLVIYEAVDSLILQTGPAATIRLNGPQIAGRRLTDVSLMPAGLLDPLSEQEIADLYAFLKSLGEPMKK